MLAVGVLAVGVLAVGVLAVGVLAVGVLVVGVVAVGVLAVGVLAVGVLAVGAVCGRSRVRQAVPLSAGARQGARQDAVGVLAVGAVCGRSACGWSACGRSGCGRSACGLGLRRRGSEVARQCSEPFTPVFALALAPPSACRRRARSEGRASAGLTAVGPRYPQTVATNGSHKG